MRKWILAMGIFLISFLAVGQALAAESQVFRDDAAMSTVVIPKNWKIQDIKGQRFAKSPDENSFILMIAAPVPPKAQGDLRGDYTLDNYSDVERATFLTNFKAGFIQRAPDMIIADSGFLKAADGHTVCYLTANSKSPEQASVYALVLIKKDQMATILGMGKNKSTFDKNKKEIEKILKTWKVD